MRLSTIFLFLVILHSHAENILSQTSVQLSRNSLTLNELINVIEEQTDFLFVFSRNDVDVNRRVSIKTKSEKITDILEEALEGSGVSYFLSNKYISLRKKTNDAPAPVAKAQQQTRITVTGTVEDSMGPTIGANVIERGTTNGTITGLDGSFTLNVAPDAVLVITYIGYKEQQIPVSGRTTFSIRLEEDSQALDEIVVTGYGTTRKRDLTGAVAVVKVDDIENIVSSNVMQSLQGRIPGVFITSNGNPNGDATVLVRGVSTLGNDSRNGPLYIIDGMPSSLGNLNEFSPQDIESIQVLKDASSASIYGSRAANGVIIITTKRGGQQQQKTTVRARASLNVKTWTKKPVEYLNTWEHGYAEWQAGRNDGNPVVNNRFYSYTDHQDANGNWVLDKIDVAEWIDDAQTMRSADTDWVKEVMRTAITQNYNVTVSTGGEKGNSLIAFDYLDNLGTIKGTSNNRMSIRVNSDYSVIKDRLTIGENLSITKTKRSASTSTSSGSGLLGAARAVQPIVPIYTESGGWGGTVGGMSNNGHNPLRMIENDKDNYNHIMRLFGDVHLDFQIIKNLHFKSMLGLDYNFEWHRQFVIPWVNGGQQDNTSRVINMSNRRGSWVWNNTFNYSFDLADGDHHFDILAGQEMLQYTMENMRVQRDGYPFFDPSYMYLSVGEGSLVLTPDASNAGTNFNGATEYKLLSYFGKANYNFRNKYLLSFTLRYDGSSRFGSNNRFATFPAFSLGWRISEEAFFQNALPMISDMKLRYGWGRTGNQDINDFASLGLYEARYDSDWLDRVGYNMGTAYDITGQGSGNLPSGYRRTQQPNPNLRWETATQNNYGVDFGLINNKLTGSFDYFFKKTTDILVSPPTIATMGEGSRQFVNGATMENRGFEVLLSYNERIGDLFFNVTGNLGSYRNKITKLPEEVLTEYPGNGIDKIIIGRPYASVYGLYADGIFKTQEEVDAHADQPFKSVGRIKYRDVNGDGQITLADRDYIGITDPDFVYGVNISAKYKQFDLTMLWSGVYGGYNNVRGTKQYTDFIGAAEITGENYGIRTLDAWTPFNSNSSIPKLSLKDDANEKQLSSYFLESKSYLKLRSLEFGYTLPESIIKAAHMQNIRLYLMGENLLTFYKKSGNNAFTGADPETPGTAYPIPLSLTFGINVSF
ncbi:MAG: TonB-dependent receptor [Tannerellaceae bacterium]|nr:TonB-dependent receptor [Tannerellaceae bacterium]